MSQKWDLFLWYIFCLVYGLQSTSLKNEPKLLNDNHLENKNASIYPSNWIPLQRTSNWKTLDIQLPVLALSNQLLKFADLELGLTTTKNAYESMSTGTKTVKSANEEIEELAVKFSGQIKEFQDALERMSTAITSNVDHPSIIVSDLPQCCQLPAAKFQFDEYFGTRVSRSSPCWTVPLKRRANTFIPSVKFSQAVMDNSAKLPQLKWQYFMSPDGVHIEYPANNQHCKNVTAGHQTIYSPKGLFEKKFSFIEKAKDDTRIHRVVFLIQLKPNTTSTMFQAVRSIVTPLLRFLDSADEVAIVGPELENPTSSFLCNQMVPVTAWTRHQILSYLNYIERVFKSPLQGDRAEEEADSSSLLQKAIDTVCSNFSSSTRFPPSAATIIHLSDGVRSTEIVNKTFNVKCPIFVDTFLLKTFDPVEEKVYKKILQSVASKNIWRVLVFYMSRTDPESFAVKVALKLNSKKEWWSLSDILNEFFPHENKSSSYSYDYSFPQWSPSSLETVIVMKKYIFNMGQPLGFVAIEIPILEFIQNVAFFMSDNICDSKSYAFLLDKFGRVISHPAFGKPDRNKEMPQIQIDQIEVHPGFSSLKRKLLLQDKGCQSLRLRQENSWIMYTWRSVERNYVIVLAFLGENSGCGARKIGFSLRKDALNPRTDVQHHLLLHKNGCCYSNLISVDKAALYLSPAAFMRPADMLNSRNLLSVKSKLPLALMAYLGDSSGLLQNQNRGMRPAIKEHISAMANTIPSWKKQFFNSNMSKYVLRRYASGAGGSFLLAFPGFTVTSGYLPGSTSWYRNAIKEPEKLVFLPPTLDLQSKIPYTTMSQSVNTEINVPFSSEMRNTSMAVVAGDVSIMFFKKTLNELLPECQNTVTENLDGRNVLVSVRCFLIDEAGYVIYHPHLTKHLKFSGRTHITHVEPLSSIDILQHGQDGPTVSPLKKRMCHKIGESSTSQSSLRRVYTLSMGPHGVHNVKHGDLCSRYVILPVPETNLFLSVVQDGCSASTAFCPCSTVDKLCLNCLRMEPTDCECPCECPREPNFCATKNFSELPDDIEVCDFPDEPFPMVKVGKNCDNRTNAELNSTQTDFSFTCDGLYHSCSSIRQIEDCIAAWDCDWCRGKLDHLAKDATCMKFTECYGYELDADGSMNSRLNESGSNELILGANEAGENDSQITLVPIIGVLSVFLFFIALVFYCYRHRTLAASNSQPDLHLLPLQDSPGGSIIPQAGSSRSDSEDTDQDVMPQEPETQCKNHEAYIFPPRSPLGSVLGTDSDHGYSTMTPNEESERGGTIHIHPNVYTDNPSHWLSNEQSQPECYNIRKGVSLKSHSLFC